jgi:hypothetical protein
MHSILFKIIFYSNIQLQNYIKLKKYYLVFLKDNLFNVSAKAVDRFLNALKVC